MVIIGSPWASGEQQRSLADEDQNISCRTFESWCVGYVLEMLQSWASIFRARVIGGLVYTMHLHIGSSHEHSQHETVGRGEERHDTGEGLRVLGAICPHEPRGKRKPSFSLVEFYWPWTFYSCISCLGLISILPLDLPFTYLVHLFNYSLVTSFWLVQAQKQMAWSGWIIWE